MTEDGCAFQSMNWIYDQAFTAVNENESEGKYNKIPNNKLAKIWFVFYFTVSNSIQHIVSTNICEDTHQTKAFSDIIRRDIQ